MALTRPAGVARIFFQEIREGDRKKLEALSNDTKSGGGARDLRVPHAKFGPIFRSLMPDDVTLKRTRGGQKVDTLLYAGKLYWVDADGKEQSAAARYEPPTDARPSEGRIAKIHSIDGLRGAVPPESDGRVFLLLVQRNDGKVFPHYVTAAQLQGKAWNASVTKAIRECMASTPEGKTVRGYVDFVRGTRYCHAK